MTSKVKQFVGYLDELYPNAICALQYHKDYELLLAVVMSAQTTDARVNSVTPTLFAKYPTLEDLKNANVTDIEKIIEPIGTFHKKAVFIQEISKQLLEKSNGIVPNDRLFLESLPGVGRKTANVVLSVLYDVPAIAVDTHVERVSKRLGLAKATDTPRQVEEQLMAKLPKKIWSKTHHQMVFFGRYQCKAIHPNCETCKMQSLCSYYQHKEKE